jgi:hypothetical protein
MQQTVFPISLHLVNIFYICLNECMQALNMDEIVQSIFRFAAVASPGETIRLLATVSHLMGQQLYNLPSATGFNSWRIINMSAKFGTIVFKVKLISVSVSVVNTGQTCTVSHAVWSRFCFRKERFMSNGTTYCCCCCVLLLLCAVVVVCCCCCVLLLLCAAVVVSCCVQTIDAQMPFFESEMLLMHHIIASTLLFITDIDTIYGIGGEGLLHVLASGASVLTSDQQRQQQFAIARELRIILPGVPAVMPVAIQTPIQSPAPTPPSTPRE